MNNNLFGKVLLMVIFTLFTVLTGCGNNEPPENLGIGKPGDIFFESTFLKVEEEKATAFYEVKYPANNLSSIVKLDLNSFDPLLIEQEFPKKWKLIFQYKEEINKQFRIPSSIMIYKYTESNNYDKFISSYELSNLLSRVPEEMAPSHNVGVNFPKEYFFETANQAVYKNTNGEKRIFNVSYFKVGK
jgi:hypothetical protein